MNKIFPVMKNHPLFGCWRYSDNMYFTKDFYISLNENQFHIECVDIYEEGEYPENPEEKININFISFKKNCVKFVTWYESVGRRAFYTLECSENKNISFLTVEYSDRTSIKRITDVDVRNPLIGVWEPEDDDFWSRYEIFKNKNKIMVKGEDFVDERIYLISRISCKENQIEFNTKCFEDGREGRHKISFLPETKEAVMDFTFTEFGFAKRIAAASSV